jgi:hypothetical protein
VVSSSSAVVATVRASISIERPSTSSWNPSGRSPRRQGRGRNSGSRLRPESISPVQPSRAWSRSGDGLCGNGPKGTTANAQFGLLVRRNASVHQGFSDSTRNGGFPP